MMSMPDVMKEGFNRLPPTTQKVRSDRMVLDK